jgi:transposase
MEEVSMSKNYKSYDEEFKKTLVSLYEGGKKLSELSREYGINESTIRPWIKKYGTVTTSTGETTTNDEISKLKKELKDVQLENEILKKAVAIFSKK